MALRQVERGVHRIGDRQVKPEHAVYMQDPKDLPHRAPISTLQQIVAKGKERLNSQQRALYMVSRYIL